MEKGRRAEGKGSGAGMELRWKKGRFFASLRMTGRNGEWAEGIGSGAGMELRWKKERFFAEFVLSRGSVLRVGQRRYFAK